MDDYIKKIREESPTLSEVTFLNHASTCPLHGKTIEAFQHFFDSWTKFDFSESRTKKEEARALFAKFINAKREEITFTPDVTQGTSLALNMLEYDKKDNIVCFWNDYVSQVYNALYLKKKKGIEYRAVDDTDGKILPEKFAESIDENTKAVLISHVQWLTGFKSDIKEITKIAHENGARVIVDTIQSTGALINDVREWDVDFLTCGVAKWLLGPNQVGYFYMKEELIDQFDPPFPGYQGTNYGNIDSPYWNVEEMEYLPGIDKFAITNTGTMMYEVALAGMQIIDNYGIKKAQDRIIHLTDYLIEQLHTIGLTSFLTITEQQYRSGVVNVKLMHSIDLAKKLFENRIVVSSRYGGLRISPHFYNTKEDIDKLVSMLKTHPN